MSTQATIYGVISTLEKYPVEEAKTLLFRMAQDLEARYQQDARSLAQPPSSEVGMTTDEAMIVIDNATDEDLKRNDPDLWQDLRKEFDFFLKVKRDAALAHPKEVAPTVDAQAGELSDDRAEEVSHEWANAQPPWDGPVERTYARTVFKEGLMYASEHGYLRPSQAIGEHTPVAWMHKMDKPGEVEAFRIISNKEKSEGVPGYVAELLQEHWTIPLYRPPMSPEARDRAIEALNESLVVWNDGDDKLVRMYIDQALSALRK